MNYFIDNKWLSLGRQIAENNFLVYKNVPENAILLLKDVSQGKEERIFMYEHNKQCWK